MTIGDYQNGFRSGWGTNDYIFILRQTTEKAYEYNINLHVLFVDFKQASNSIKRIKIYEMLQQTEMPAKLVRLIKEGRKEGSYLKKFIFKILSLQRSKAK
jgi:hypothetical protein